MTNDIKIYKVFLDNLSIQKCKAHKITDKRVYFYKSNKKISMPINGSDYVFYENKKDATDYLKYELEDQISDLSYELEELKEKLNKL